MQTDSELPAVAVIGAGSIGTGWAIVFAEAGHEVRLFDAVPERLGAAQSEIAERLSALAEFDLLDEATVVMHLSVPCCRSQRCNAARAMDPRLGVGQETQSSPRDFHQVLIQRLLLLHLHQQ